MKKLLCVLASFIALSSSMTGCGEPKNNEEYYGIWVSDNDVSISISEDRCNIEGQGYIGSEEDFKKIFGEINYNERKSCYFIVYQGEIYFKSNQLISDITDNNDASSVQSDFVNEDSNIKIYNDFSNLGFNTTVMEDGFHCGYHFTQRMLEINSYNFGVDDPYITTNTGDIYVVTTNSNTLIETKYRAESSDEFQSALESGKVFNAGTYNVLDNDTLYITSGDYAGTTVSIQERSGAHGIPVFVMSCSDNYWGHSIIDEGTWLFPYILIDFERSPDYDEETHKFKYYLKTEFFEYFDKQ